MKKPVALITGASRGIGRNIALKLASKGYDLLITCHNNISELEEVQKQCEKYSVTVHTYSLDIGNFHQVETMFNTFQDFIANLEVLVNNAGIAHYGLLQDMTTDQWHSLLNTNLSGLFYTSKLSIPIMLKRGSGNMVNISSIWGNDGASCEVAYSATKGGVNSFTKALAKELAPSNIRVNAIACGVIDTDMNAHLSSQERTSLIESIGLGRLGRPEEVSETVAFLISPSSSYLTGQIITLDGGIY